MSLRDVGEVALLRRIRTLTDRGDEPGVVTGIGDDTAVLAVARDAALLATTDLVIEGIHFRFPATSPRDVGWKAMAVNLSDIAAMGGTPRYALVALAVPASTQVEDVEAFYGGMCEAASLHGVTIVGGDTSASPAGWIVNLTLLGEHPGTPRLRSAAKPRDAVAVTGTLGGSAAGLAVLEMGTEQALTAGISPASVQEITTAHRRPHARVAEGVWLGRAAGVHAMMDCSDGLAADLAHICRESGVGARVMLDRLPVAPSVREAARALGRDPLPWAAAGGEDYELLLTCDPGAVATLAAGLRSATGTALTVIGEIEAGAPGISWLGPDGAPVTMPGGYEHFVG